MLYWATFSFVDRYCPWFSWSPSSPARCHVARARLSLPVHGGFTPARPLWADGRLYTAPTRPEPHTGPVQPDCGSPHGGGPGLPPLHFRTAPVPVGPHQTSLPVSHSLHSRRTEAWGEQSQGAALLQSSCTGACACRRWVKLEWAGTYARRTQPPLCGCNGGLPVCCWRGGGAHHWEDLCSKDCLSIWPQG